MLKLSELIERQPLQGSRILAGADGIDRGISRLCFLETPSADEYSLSARLVMSRSFPFRTLGHSAGDDKKLMRELVDRGAQALVLKLGPSTESISGAALALADQASFPVIGLPTDLAWAAMVNSVLSELMPASEDPTSSTERLFDAFAANALREGGFEGLARSVACVLGVAVAITDRNLDVLSQAGVEDEVLHLAGVVGALVGAGSGHGAAENQFSADRMTLGDGLSRALYDGRSYLTLSLRPRGRLEGYIFLLEPQERDFSPAEAVAVRKAGVFASLEFLKQRAVRTVERRFGSDFVLDLVSGRLDSLDAMKRRASHFGLDLDYPQALLLVDLRDGTPSAPGAATVAPDAGTSHPARERLQVSITRTLRRLGRSGTALPIGNRLIVLLPVRPGQDRNDVKAFAGRVGESIISDAQAAGFGPDEISAGIGRFYPAIDRLPEVYRQAKEALDIGCGLRGPGRAYHFDDLGLFRLLAHGGKGSESLAFVDDTLGPLIDHDNRHGSELVRTLEAFLEANGNLSQASRSLVVHVNTLKYRLAKIEEITGRSFDDADVRLNALIALKIAKAYPVSARSDQRQPPQPLGLA